jgi:hypothetical protein
MNWQFQKGINKSMFPRLPSQEVDAEKVSDATPDLGDAAASAHSDVPPVPAQACITRKGSDLYHLIIS